MIFLEFLEGQGLGNQLWNYVTLRSLSKVLRFDYRVLYPEKFKGKNFLDISYSNIKNLEFHKDLFPLKNIFSKASQLSLTKIHSLILLPLPYKGIGLFVNILKITFGINFSGSWLGP